jgi:threonylcarbamoyladenosine tRNA methylthiotransferase CDKAL1
MTTFYMKTFGCSLNKSDSEIMIGLLLEKGFTMVAQAEKAEVQIVNTCTVKGTTERNVLRFLDALKSLKRPIVVAGCLPQVSPDKLDGYGLLGPNELMHIVEVVEETMNENPVRFLGNDRLLRPALPRKRQNPVIEIVPISSGCLGSCSYCIVKKARGNLISYEIALIVKQIRQALREGVKELWLTAQDTGCYGSDEGTSLVKLLREVVSLEGDFLVRVGMMNPNFALEMKDDLSQILKDPKMFRFLHIPVQSGSDRILKIMGRSYTVSQFKEAVESYRRQVPDITISTDVICGFPGESKEEFMESVELIRNVKPDVLNVSRFWPRPGTPASSLAQLPEEEKKHRTEYMLAMFKWIAFENNKRWRNWRGRVIVDGTGKNGSWLGRNFAYKPIVLDGSYRLGEELDVAIENTTTFDLRAVPMQGTPTKA